MDRRNSLLLLLLAACAPASQESTGETGGDSSKPVGSDAWLQTVSSRIAAASRAFEASPDGYQARRLDLSVTLTAGAARIATGKDQLTLETVAFGRDELQVLEMVEPQTGECGSGGVDPEGNCIARIEFARPGLTEWWENNEQGFEQGWDLETAPAGEGPVQVALMVSGGTVLDGQDELSIVTEGGALLSYGGLAAWDAEGRELPAHMYVVDGQIRVEVDDAAAVYPIHVDPVLTTATTILKGSTTYDSLFGLSVAGAGDVNNDGYDDVVVGAPEYGATFAGAVYVYHGSSTGISTTASFSTTGSTTYYYTELGFSVDGAGDINKDGYDDIVVGAAYYSTSAFYQGRVYVYYGSSTGITTSGASTITGGGYAYYLGYSVAGAGDVNGDSYADIVIGAEGYNNEQGRAYVHLGSATGINTTATRTWTGANTADSFGYSVAGAGDVNKDGYADVIVGAPFYTSTDYGRAYIYHGTSSGINSSATTTLTGAAAYDRFGYSVSGAGDVNGDTYADVVIGIPRYDASTSVTNSGEASVYYGSSSGISSSSPTVVKGASTNDYLGWSVAGAGDINNDGYGDVVVGAVGYGSNYSGAVYVYEGSSTGLTTTAVNTLLYASVDDEFGVSVNGAGDVNNDGYDDIIVGADGYTAGSFQGAAYIFHGYALDNDGDGYTVAGGDCNDNNAAIRPGATEICDSLDNDCDSLVDDADPGITGQSTWYVDADADAYGSAATSKLACTQPTGYVSNKTDCDDSVKAVNPGATEICNSIDDNCDGLVDNNATNASTYYADADGDAYGSTTSSTTSCSQPSGYVTNNTDCNDGNAAINPSAAEICDGVDNDCNGTIDINPVSGATTYYKDADSDTYGSSSATISACSQPAGYVTNSTDCNDADAAINPGASEVCNSKDDNCDGLVDNGASGGSTYYRDADADTYGDAATTTTGCTQPSGYVANKTDCNDADASINPGATEVCNGKDDNCDGQVDNGAVAVTWYRDADGDGYGSFPTTVSCAQPVGYVTVAGDCNDSSAAVNPAATETCNNVDDNCDGTVDNNVASAPIWYKDADGDTYGDANSAQQACSQPTGYVSNKTDCNDGAKAVNPGATEVCNSIDDDCDGIVDNATVGGKTWYADADGDGYGGTTTQLNCSQPTGYVATGGDCDDTRPTVNPAGTETCNNIDDNCDGTIDNNATNASTWYKDLDGDTYGSTTSTKSCTAPTGYVASNTDCNDSNAAINPGAAETVANSSDDNCDGSELCYVDADGDKYRDTLGTTVVSGNLSCADAGEADATVPNTDCNDADKTINPAASETCNGVDDNCDGLVDNGATNTQTWYADADGDKYGSASSATVACTPPTGYIANSTDCDDTNASINPGATEVVGDSVDQNCDGKETCYLDLDGDNYRETSGVTLSSVDTDCYDALEGSVSDPATDCDDSNKSINPGAAEICDGIDNDCDGTVDINAANATTWYADADSDGYGGPLDLVSCSKPSGYVSNSNDCDDSNKAVSPAATEVCNSIDDNCDGQVDNGVANAPTWYADADGDTFGDAAATTTACTQPTGYVADATDCNDLSISVNPAATETCNNVDDNCDGLVDNNAVGGSNWYADIDGDTYGDLTNVVSACNQPTGYVANSGDCNDQDPAYNPGVTETCTDKVDYNCDGSIGFTDADGDGYAACQECDDLHATVYPGATETCDNLDNDCNGYVDDNVATAPYWYPDADKDGYGSSVGLQSCSRPYGYLTDSSDCNDGSNAVFPGAVETCNGVDDDCNGTVDDNATNPSTWYADQDGDTYGDANTTVASCSAPSGYVSDATDCDDRLSIVNPGAPELCDGLDNDCNGAVDDNAIDQTTWYVDVDGDTFGDSAQAPIVSCDQPLGYVADGGDCNDADTAYFPGATETCTDLVDYNCDGSIGYTDADLDGYAACEECDDSNAAVYPGATEICDGLDNDCNLMVDDNATDALTWYTDADGDTYGDAASTTISSCTAPAGTVADATDCDDSNAAIFPGAPETCTDTVDLNCDGSVGAVDADLDGVIACLDCNDADGAINPNADEVCDGVDNNCDGSTDLNAVDAAVWYLDQDQDTYGDPGQSLLACDQPVGAADNGSDCQDQNNTVYPGAPELCDGIDNNCDTTVDEGCDTGDTGDTAIDTGDTAVDTGEYIPDSGNVDTGEIKGGGTCGCAETSGSATGGLAGLLGLAALLRRRRNE